ncbi:MAG: right-handed parallel beta-helix repeat-containing protein [Bacteroidales bacterium]|jgi:hypothetical protein|nr:right-handed parallel beta-helix repeat-containing protein [Bacteroidales bacterium]
MKKSYFLLAGLFILFSSCSQKEIYHLSDYGLHPDSRENASPLFAAALENIWQNCDKHKKIWIILPAGRYDFYPEQAALKEYYISNHDQTNPKCVGIPFENMKNITFDGQGSELIFHGRMLPISLINSQNCTLKNFHIDFENPHISQVQVIENDPEAGSITFKVAPWVKYGIRDSTLVAMGHGWEHISNSGIAFEEKTKRLVYRTSDLRMGSRGVAEVSPGVIRSFKWKDARLVPGTVIAMRGPGRPTPGIFMSHDTNTRLENIQVHYAEGMGLLAQMSENITLDGFSVCLRGEDDPRYFTAQADATHFSGCKGKIISTNGLYEGMMDDAINIHGTYLKVIRRTDDKTLEGRYMHGQSYGFEWGRPGDAVQFIRANTMEICGTKNEITTIESIDKPSEHGAKEFRITFREPLDPEINESGPYGIENLEWTPEVVFSHNTIRNNRARGTLFSTPKRTVIEHNLFDHTSGSAILLCGDCNGWFETGACHDVVIRKNKFINSLTNMFQFTNAIISIYPVIPDLENQKEYFHSGIVIEDNIFETFDIPIVYAKSVDGLIFRNNIINHNHDYPAFHRNKKAFLFERVTNYTIKGNTSDGQPMDEPLL